MNRQEIHRHIEGHMNEHVEEIQRWVRQRSASWDYSGIRECANLVAKTFRELGCVEVEIMEGRFHPGVWAFYDAQQEVSLHNYGYFDTANASAKDWEHNPWSGELVEKNPYPRVVVGRGAWSGKGPYVAWLNALSSIIAVEGTLPVNIMFLVEGEDLMYSPSYADFVERKIERLKRVNASFCPNPSQDASGSVAVGLGMKSLIGLEVICSASEWGYGPKSGVFSGAAGLVDNPAARLVQALSTLTHGDGRGCNVKGIEELMAFRKPLTVEERELVDRLVKRFQGRDFRELMLGGKKNVDQMVGGTEGINPLLNWLYGASFTIVGLYGGFLGRGTGTDPFIVPHEARAMLELRAVVDVPPEKLVALIRQHLDSHGFTDIKIDVYAAFDHSTTPLSHPTVQATVQTLRDWRIEPVVWPMQAMGGARAVVPNAFGVPLIRGSSLGYGHGSLGDVDEYMVIQGDGKVSGLAEVEKYYVDFLYKIASSLK